MNPADRPRRALLLFPQTYAAGGIQRCSQTFQLALSRLGIDCDLLTLLDPVDIASRAPASPGLRVRGFAGRRLSFALAVARALATRRYDFVLVGHINFAILAALTSALAIRHAPRLLMVAHGIEVWRGLRGIQGLALRCFDDILCVSRYTRDRIRAQLPHLRESALRVHHNALHPEWVATHRNGGGNAPPSAALPARFLLSVTRLDTGERYKGIVTTLESFGTLDDPGLHYVIAGSGNDLDFLRAVAARLGVASRVHFLGNVSDAELVTMYRSCQAFVLPSGKEGFGIVFLEAMFFGAPVLGARAGGAVDAVDEGRTGLLSEFGDSVALRENLAAVLDDESLRQRLRAQARADVTNGGPFTFEAFTRRLGQLLGEGRPA